MGLVEDLKKFLDSPEGQKKAEDYFGKIKQREIILDSQLDRFHQRVIFQEPQLNKFIEKVVTKYSSDKYRDHWYNRGIEPPENLYWFLYKYAQKWGREATEEEYETIGNYFTSGLYLVGNYSFNRMDGQGSCILVEKVK
jgi:hypothetical protein